MWKIIQDSGTKRHAQQPISDSSRFKKYDITTGWVTPA
jgi:hypothetical protein